MLKTNEKNRDYLIEGLRFIATIGIVVFHYEWIYVGHPIFFQHFYLFVEFFFALSGFFLAHNIQQKRGSDTLEYIKKTTIKLYVPYLFAFVFSLGVYCIIYKTDFFVTLYNSRWEVLMMQLSGIAPSVPQMNSVTAYIPALIMASVVVHYMLNEHFTFFKNVFGILAPMFIYAHIISEYGNLSQWGAFESYFSVGFLRGVAGMAVGAESYIWATEYLKSKKVIIRRLLGVVSIIMIGALVFDRSYISYTDEIIYPYVFAMILAIAYCREHGNNYIFSKILGYLGKISYGIFLVHYGVCVLVANYLPGKSYFMMLMVCVSVSVFVGILLTKVSQIIFHKIKI